MNHEITKTELESNSEAVKTCVENFLSIVPYLNEQTLHTLLVVTNPLTPESLFEKVLANFKEQNASVENIDALIVCIQILRLQQRNSAESAQMMGSFMLLLPRGKKIVQERAEAIHAQLEKMVVEPLQNEIAMLLKKQVSSS